jgi:uncharacterized protein (DUF1330 family)
MYYLEPGPQQFENFLENFPAAQPVVMLNLLRFVEQANYLPEHDALPCTGFEAYMRYGEAVVPLIEKVAGKSIWQGKQKAMLIGPQDKDWQLIVLVKYPNPQAFIDMAMSPDYQKISFHRTAALLDSRLIAMEEF